MVLCAACGTTTEQRALATQRLDQAWRADNQTTRAALGRETVEGTPAQAYRAAKLALPRIGLPILEEQSQPPTIKGEQLFPGGSFSWSPAVRQAEEARMRGIFVEAIGPAGARLQLAPIDEILTGVVKVQPAGKGETEVLVDFQTRSTAGCPTPSCVNAMPPDALRAAFFQFWTAFNEELTEIRAQDAAKAEAAKPSKKGKATGARKPPRPPARPKPPSDWVLPPSGWKPPPKGG